MLKRLIPLALALSIAMPAVAVPPADRQWKQVLKEDFNTLDTKLWTSGILAWGSQSNPANGEKQTYQATAATVSNGVLYLTANRRGTGYTSGIVQSYNKFSYQTGYAEARIKFPAGKGLWGAFWQLENNSAFPWPGAGEVDVIEFLGNQKTTANVNLHYEDENGYGNDPKAVTTADMTTDYHLYGVDIQPTKIDYYIDGKKVHTVSARTIAKPEYLIANLAVGGAWPGDPDSATRFPAQMLIDYIYVWTPVEGTPTTPSALQVNCSFSGKVEGGFSIPCTVK